MLAGISWRQVPVAGRELATSADASPEATHWRPASSVHLHREAPPRHASPSCLEACRERPTPQARVISSLALVRLSINAPWPAVSSLSPTTRVPLPDLHGILAIPPKSRLPAPSGSAPLSPMFRRVGSYQFRGSTPISLSHIHSLSSFLILIFIFFSFQNSPTRSPKGCTQDLSSHVCRAPPQPLGRQGWPHSVSSRQDEKPRLLMPRGGVGVKGRGGAEGRRLAGWVIQLTCDGRVGGGRKGRAFDAYTYAASPVAAISRRPSHLSPGLSKHQFTGVHGLPLSRSLPSTKKLRERTTTLSP